ncbi:MAG: hypothetical protein ACETWM_06785 [Candidatus Lokiarchaeia archaeon]
MSPESKYKPNWKNLINKFNSILNFEFRHEVESYLQEYMERLSQNYKEVWEKFYNKNVKSSMENVRKFFEKTKEGERLRTISLLFVITLIGGLIIAIALRFILIHNEILFGYSIVPETGIYGVIFAFYFIGAYLAYYYFTTRTWRQSLKRNKELAMEKLKKELDNIRSYMTYLSEFSKKISSETSQKISRIVKAGTKISEDEETIIENQEIPDNRDFREEI